MPKFSVIVPVYNTEKYLPRCIESILNQTVTDFELLLIDDGSPDKCGEICDEFARKDKRIFVFHIDNGGVSRARNLGIKNAKGEYICFIDSDDTIGSNYLNILFPKDNEDFVQSGVRVLENDYLKPIMTHEEIYKDYNRFWLESRQQWPTMCCYSKKIIDDNKLRYNTSIRMGEDGLFNHIFISKCQIIRRTKENDYYYNHDNELSASHKYYPDRLEQEIMLIKDLKNTFSVEQIYRVIWDYWRGAINHYIVKGLTNEDKKKDAKKRIKCAYKSVENRVSIKFIRKNGSLDEKIESFLMGYYRHKLYKPALSTIQFVSRVKSIGKQ